MTVYSKLDNDEAKKLLELAWNRMASDQEKGTEYRKLANAWGKLCKAWQERTGS